MPLIFDGPNVLQVRVYIARYDRVFHPSDDAACLDPVTEKHVGIEIPCQDVALARA